MNDLLSGVKIKLIAMSTAKFQMFDEMEGDAATCAVPVANLSGVVPGLPVRIRQPLGNMSYLKQDVLGCVGTQSGTYKRFSYLRWSLLPPRKPSTRESGSGVLIDVNPT